MYKVSNIATWIQRVALYLIVPLIIIMRLISWGKINANSLYLIYSQIQKSSIEHDISTLPLVGKYLFFLLESVSTFCLLFALWYFLKILKLYKHNMLFTKEVISMLKRINIIILAWAVYQFFFNTLASLLISAFKPAGQRYIMASISFNDVLNLFIILILFMIMHLIQEAHKIKTEQDLVV